MSACFHINVKHPFQPLSPGHGRPALFWCFILLTDFWPAFAAPRGCDLDSVFAIRCEYAVEAREIDPRFGHQRCQFRNKIQRVEYDVGRAIGVRCFELVADITSRCQRKAFFRYGRAGVNMNLVLKWEKPRR